MNTGNETTIYTQDHFLKAASVSKQFLDAGWGEGSGRWRLLATRRELTDGPIEASPKALTEAHVRLESQLTNTLTLSLSLSLSLMFMYSTTCGFVCAYNVYNLQQVRNIM